MKATSESEPKVQIKKKEQDCLLCRTFSYQILCMLTYLEFEYLGMDPICSQNRAENTISDNILTLFIHFIHNIPSLKYKFYVSETNYMLSKEIKLFFEGMVQVSQFR